MESKKIDINRIISEDAKIDELKLSAPVHNVLMRSGIKTILKLITLTEDELFHLENGNLKAKGVQEIESKIAALNIPDIRIGMDINNYELFELIQLKDFLNDITKLRNKCLKLNSGHQDRYLKIIDNLALSVYESIEDKKEYNKSSK